MAVCRLINFTWIGDTNGRESSMINRRLAFSSLGLIALLALWQLGFVLGGPFVLPAPFDVMMRVEALIRGGDVWQPALTTTAHVVIGYAVGCALGISLGLIGGAIKDLGTALNAVSTVILGIPPIIWIVLALLWFGPRGIVPAFTVAIGVAPVVFAATIAGMRSSHPEFDELAAAFQVPWRQHLWEIRVPQVMVALLPALATGLGMSWKMALMAEVFGGGSGIGGQIADARAYLDTTETMAWVVVALGLLLVADGLLAKFVATSSLVE
jgi:NitT/TauT family transport system permease protein